MRRTARDVLLRHFFRRRWRGFETLYRVTGRAAIVAPNRYGVPFALDPHDYVDSVVLRDGFYESEVYEALRPGFTGEAVFWDVGACFGLHAITAAILHPDLRVYAFEPNPASQERLRRNCRLNRVKVALQPFALSDREGDTPLFVSPPGNSGMATIRPFSPSHFSPIGRVPIRRADKLIAAHVVPPPTVLKLDVEGSEAAVLAGLGAHLYAQTLRRLVLECGPAILDPQGGDPLRKLLVEAGFSLRGLHRLEDTAHTLINVLATRTP